MKKRLSALLARPSQWHYKVMAILVPGLIVGFGYVISSGRAATVPGDINGDGTVSVLDLSILLSHWNANYAAADLNSDGTVNILDLSTLLSHWGQTGSTPTPTPKGPMGTGKLIAKPLGSTAAANGYYEYLPLSYNGSTPAPLIIFFHGVGENGNGTSQLASTIIHGPGQAIQAGKYNTSLPFVILSPQHSGSGCPSGDEIHNFINYAQQTYAIDPKRIYLTGLSCGAIGPWNYFAKYADQQVAAAVLLSGDDEGNAWSTQGCVLVSSTAFWGIHGTVDGTVSFPNDQALFNHLAACPQPRTEVKFTPVQGADHDIPWDGVYDNTLGLGDIYQWMLSHTKP